MRLSGKKEIVLIMGKFATVFLIELLFIVGVCECYFFLLFELFNRKFKYASYTLNDINDYFLTVLNDKFNINLISIEEHIATMD